LFIEFFVPKKECWKYHEVKENNKIFSGCVIRDKGDKKIYNMPPSFVMVKDNSLDLVIIPLKVCDEIPTEGCNEKYVCEKES
jgi:hypothetical protein